jgi:preprotein translocase SecE subunit
MFKFIKESLAEFDHVAWPTKEENKSYMLFSVGIILFLGILLAVWGYAVKAGMTAGRGMFDHDMPTLSGSTSTSPANNTNNVLNALQAATKSGATISTGVVATSTDTGKISTGTVGTGTAKTLFIGASGGTTTGTGVNIIR